MERKGKRPKFRRGPKSEKGPKTPNRPGGKSPYKPEFVGRAREFMKTGKPQYELGTLFNVSHETIWRWMKRYPDFAAAVKEGYEASGAEWPEQHDQQKVYRPNFARIARKMCMFGATDQDLAEALGVGRRCIKTWQVKHKEFSEACNVGKDEFDAQVERSLAQRATGYDHEAVKIFMPRDGDKPIYAPYMEHIPADVGAAKHWLAVRKPETWAVASEATNNGVVLRDYRDLTIIEIARRLLVIEQDAKREKAKLAAQKLPVIDVKPISTTP